MLKREKKNKETNLVYTVFCNFVVHLARRNKYGIKRKNNKRDI